MHRQHVERLEGEDQKVSAIARALMRARIDYVCTLRGTFRQRVKRLMREPALVRAVELHGTRRQRRSANKALGLLRRARTVAT